MAIKKIFIIIFGVSLFISALIFVSLAKAQSISSISYPIPELGNCGSQEECRVFCDDLANQVACTQWATKNGLMPKEKVTAVEREVEQIKKFESGEIPEGPGGCKSPEECDVYCQKPEHGEECFKFGVEHGLISPEEAEQIQKKVEESKGPGGCKTNEECNIYCSKPEHVEECIDYGVKDGTLTQSEANELRDIMARERVMREAGPLQAEKFHPEPKKPKINDEKVKKILKAQKGPGGCLALEECKEYCSSVDHAEECLAFAQKNGLASPKELEEMKNIMKTGGPGGCRGARECDDYCSLPDHQDECLKFAKEQGLISPEEAKMMEERTKGGPGGCRNQQECDAYCREPQHMEECLMFSVKEGFMSKEDAQRMMEIMKTQEEKGLQMKGVPPAEGMAPQMPHMFEKGMPKQDEWHSLGGDEQALPKNLAPAHQQEPKNISPQEQMTGPGGCESQAECDAYCQKPEHRKECSGFSGNESGPPEGRTPEEGGYELPKSNIPQEGFDFQKGYQPPGEYHPDERYRPPEGVQSPEGYKPSENYRLPEGQMPPQGYEQMPPEGQVPPQETPLPPETAPQSFLERMKNFFASIIFSLSRENRKE